jgi:hypothetical protein
MGASLYLIEGDRVVPRSLRDAVLNLDHRFLDEDARRQLRLDELEFSGKWGKGDDVWLWIDEETGRELGYASFPLIPGRGRVLQRVWIEPAYRHQYLLTDAWHACGASVMARTSRSRSRMPRCRRTGKRVIVTSDLLCGCHEHLGCDAGSPGLRGCGRSSCSSALGRHWSRSWRGAGTQPAPTLPPLIRTSGLLRPFPIGSHGARRLPQSRGKGKRCNRGAGSNSWSR